MSRHHEMFLRQGLIGTCALVALVLLALFYSTVSGAVERAARQRIAATDASSPALAAAGPRRAARGNALVARLDN